MQRTTDERHGMAGTPALRLGMHSTRAGIGAIVALTAGLATIGPARAGLITETLTGTVGSGLDNGNMFGGGNLVGDVISLTFSYDPGLSQYQAPAGSNEEYYYAYDSYAISESVTVQSQSDGPLTVGTSFLANCAGAASIYDQELSQPTNTPTRVLLNFGSGNCGNSLQELQFDIRSTTVYQTGNLMAQTTMNAVMGDVTVANLVLASQVAPRPRRIT